LTFDVTIVTSDSLAVTLPDSETIQFISPSSDSLSPKNKLKVDGKSHDISHHQGKLAVTFLNQTMDWKGNTEITVDTDSCDDNILRVSRFVATNSNSIYVSDNGKGVVMRFNWQGQLLERQAGIRYVRGITLLNDGLLLVISIVFF
jgi:hypothetical protein